MVTTKNIPDVVRSDTSVVTPATARYSIEDRRAAIAELDARPDPSHEVHVVYGRLRAEVQANDRGGALPAQTRYVLALIDVYEQRVRARLGYGRMPLAVAALGGGAA